MCGVGVGEGHSWRREEASSDIAKLYSKLKKQRIRRNSLLCRRISCSGQVHANEMTCSARPQVVFIRKHWESLFRSAVVRFVLLKREAVVTSCRAINLACSRWCLEFCPVLSRHATKKSPHWIQQRMCARSGLQFSQVSTKSSSQCSFRTSGLAVNSCVVLALRHCRLALLLQRHAD